MEPPVTDWIFVDKNNIVDEIGDGNKVDGVKIGVKTAK